MSAPKKKKPSFGERLDTRIEKLSDAFDDMRVQLKNGRHKKRLKRILSHIETMPGGAKMLETARKNGVAIQVLRPQAMKGAAGKLTRYSKSPSTVSIANNGDDVQMALTLWHELRHVQQMHDWGRLDPGNTGRIKDTKRMHVLSMMIEADAYTSQTLMALKAKEQGQGEYLDALMRRRTRAFNAIKGFLEKNPYDPKGDEGAFSRALFAEVMKKGLSGYSVSYQKNYAQVFNAAASAKSFHGSVKRVREPPAFKPSNLILQVYRSDALGEISLDDLVLKHFQAQPEELQKTLELIDMTVNAAPRLDEELYQKSRKFILSRLPKPDEKEEEKTPRQKLADAFNRAVRKLNPANLWRKKAPPQDPKNRKPAP
ncbi:MAG: hypothetical protein GC185_03725 [Alphaproteobacteria bacterium]|nr:hypothetical protein [Alphaproteobacteria bacterium]